MTVVETNKNSFVCPKCTIFSTEFKTEYEEHLINEHLDFDKINCIYCSSVFSTSEISNHIEAHFKEDGSLTNVCIHCKALIRVDNPEKILEHLLLRHNDQILCPLCEINFEDDTQLINHINENIKLLYHCNYKNCRVQTFDIEELYFHFCSSGHYSDSSFEESIFTCQWKPDLDLCINESDSFIKQLTINTSALKTLPSSAVKKIEEIEQIDLECDSKSTFNYIVKLRCKKELFEDVFINVNHDVSAYIKEKLFSIDKYYIGVSMNDSKKIFYCSHCSYSSHYSHADVRKHIFMLHCAISYIHIRKCLKVIEFINDEKFKQLTNFYNKIHSQKIEQNQSDKVSVEILNKNSLPTNSQSIVDSIDFNCIIKLCVNQQLFNELFSCSSRVIIDLIKKKLNMVEKYTIGVLLKNDQKSFYCIECSYFSKYCHADVRKHIIGGHLGVPHAYVRNCLKIVRFISNKDMTNVNDSMEEKENCSQIFKETTEMLEGSPRANSVSSNSSERTDEKVDVSSSCSHDEVKRKKSLNVKLEHYESNIDFESSNLNLKISKKRKANRKSLITNCKRSKEKLTLNRKGFSQPHMIIPMDYSRKVFEKYFRNYENDFVSELHRQMEFFTTFSIEVNSLRNTKWFTCSECYSLSSYVLTDIKTHLMVTHCGISSSVVGDCLKLCPFDSNFKILLNSEIIKLINQDKKSNDNSLLSDEEAPNKRSKSCSFQDPSIFTTFSGGFNGLMKQVGRLSDSNLMKISNPIKICFDREIRFTFSENILETLCDLENLSSRLQETKEKLKFYCKTKVKVGRSKKSPMYICTNCNWITLKSISTVSDHIIREHTGITDQLIPLVEMCTKMDGNGKLLSDNEISSLGWKNKPILLKGKSPNAYIDLT